VSLVFQVQAQLALLFFYYETLVSIAANRIELGDLLLLG
jgi:hypothetical protein